MTTHSVRERIVREVIRRIEANNFQSVRFDKVQRTEVPDEYDASQGSLLAVLDGHEDHKPTAGRVREVSLTVLFSFAVPLAAGEEAQTIANNVAAEIIGALSGQHTMEEGGDGSGGTKLACGFTAVAVDPDLIQQNTECAAATVEFLLRYRTATNDLFAV